MLNRAPPVLITAMAVLISNVVLVATTEMRMDGEI